MSAALLFEARLAHEDDGCAPAFALSADDADCAHRREVCARLQLREERGAIDRDVAQRVGRGLAEIARRERYAVRIAAGREDVEAVRADERLVRVRRMERDRAWWQDRWRRRQWRRWWWRQRSRRRWDRRRRRGSRCWRWRWNWGAGAGQRWRRRRVRDRQRRNRRRCDRRRCLAGDDFD